MLTHTWNTRIILTLAVFLGVLSFFIHIHWLSFLGLFLVWLTIAAVGSFSIGMNYHLKAFTGNKDISEKKIALTFDDGPHPMTEPILDLLKRYKAKATFFCIGKQIEKYPEIFQRIIKEGHTVGNHSYSHSANIGFFTVPQMLDEIKLANAVIEKQSGKKATYYRPPFGVTNPKIAKALQLTGHSAIGWNIRSLDTVTDDENKIYERIISRLRPGSIVLMHDTSQKTVNVTERLLLFFQIQAYESVAVEQLLNISPYEV